MTLGRDNSVFVLIGWAGTMLKARVPCIGPLRSVADDALRGPQRAGKKGEHLQG